MVDLSMLKETFGILLILTSIFDGFKYSLQAFKLQKAGTAKAQSRKFVLMAIGNDIVKTIYGALILDIYIFASSVFALICMFHLWVVVYHLYDYRQRGLHNFKRPSLLKFTVNAMVPNHLRKKL